MKYYIAIEFLQGQSRTYCKYPLLQAIIEGHGSDSLRDLGQKAGLKSPQQVKHYLLQMMANGLIYRDSQGYSLTPEAKKAIRKM